MPASADGRSRPPVLPALRWQTPIRLFLSLALIGLLALLGAPSVTAADTVAPAHHRVDCAPAAPHVPAVHHGDTDMAAHCPHPGLCLVASLPAAAEADARGAAHLVCKAAIAAIPPCRLNLPQGIGRRAPEAPPMSGGGSAAITLMCKAAAFRRHDMATGS
ncbi:hypothetical protein [Albidovulum sp.]|uniref:hypothetical protein n=1 Tax=Albidovulum sp. TaxID=1872424 RepID=UPI0039B848C7